MEGEAQRVGNQRVSDRYLGDLADGAEQHQVVEVQVVTGVHPQAQLAGIAGRIPVALEHRQGLGVVDAELGGGVGERAGIELDPIGADRSGAPSPAASASVYEPICGIVAVTRSFFAYA